MSYDSFSNVIDLLQLGASPCHQTGAQAKHSRQQSEALRKMLLAVVSDVRLVLVRIAEQLYRLRQAKHSIAEEQHADGDGDARNLRGARESAWCLAAEMGTRGSVISLPGTGNLPLHRGGPEGKTHRTRGFHRYSEIDAARGTAQAGVDAEISGRPKHIYSIWRKMQRKDRGLESCTIFAPYGCW